MEKLMKYKLLLSTLALCGGSLLLNPVLADDQSASTSVRAADSGKELRLGQWIGAKVQDLQGDKVGQIEDFLTDPTSGRVQFAILKLTGDFARNGAYAPVPWPLLANANVESKQSGEPKTVILNVDKAKLQSGARFSVNRWPEQSHPTWGQDVYSNYGIPWEGLGATGAAIGTDTGTGVSDYRDTQHYRHHRNYQHEQDRSTEKPIDNGTAPDGKDVFHFHPRPWPNSEFPSE